METASRYNTLPYVNSLQRWRQRRSGTSVRRQSKPPPHWHFGPLSGEKAIPTQDSGGRTAALVQHQCGYCEYAAGTVARRRGHPFVCQWWWSGTTPERGCPCTAAGASGTRAQPLVMDAMSAINRAWARATGSIGHWLPVEGALPCSVCAWQAWRAVGARQCAGATQAPHQPLRMRAAASPTGHSTPSESELSASERFKAARPLSPGPRASCGSAAGRATPASPPCNSFSFSLCVLIFFCVLYSVVHASWTPRRGSRGCFRR